MASSLSISVRADTAEARAQLALVTADIGNVGKALRQAANDARGSGFDGVTDNVRRLAGQMEALRAEQTKLNSEMKETATGGFARFNEGVKSAVEPLTLLSSRMRETAEIAGITFALDKIREYISSMGELGEKTVNMAAAVGTTPHEFSLLSNALVLAGGDADTVGRTLTQLGRNMEMALSQPSSQAAKAINSLGISHEQLTRMSTNLGYALDVLADKFQQLDDNSIKTADYAALMGRGFQGIVPALRNGSAGLGEFKQAAQDTGNVLSNEEAQALDETGEKVHLLAMTLEGQGVRGFLSIKGAIDKAIDSLTSFVKWAGDAISEATRLPTAEAQAEHFRQVREGKTGGQPTPSSPGDYLDPRTHRWRALPTGGLPGGGPAEMNVGGMTIPTPVTPSAADQDLSASGKPSAAAWPSTTRGGGGKGGGAAKGQADEMETWREELQQKLEAEHNFFADSTAQELAFWQQKVNLTSAGSKERAQVESTIYALQKRQAVEAERDQEQSIAAQMRVSDAVYERQVQAIESEERLGKISAAAAVAQEQTLLDQKWAADQAYYAKKKAAADGDTKTQQQVDNAQLVAYQAYLTQKQRLDEQAATQEKKAAEDMAKPYVDAFDQIGTKFEDTITGLIERTTTWQKAFKSIIDQVLKDFIGMVGKMASSAAGSVLGNALEIKGGAGQGGDAGSSAGSFSLGGVLGSLAGGLFGKIGGAAGAGLLNLIGGASGDQDFSGAVGGAGSESGTGILGPILGGLLHLIPGFARGGIVPSAAGGWSVPSLGSGGTLANLHSNEMVLPANLSNFVQGAAASASGSGGGGHTFNLGPIVTPDASATGRLFMNNGSTLVAALNKAIRNGSSLNTGG